MKSQTKNPLHEISRLYEQWGLEHYDEKISQLDHGLQTADLARMSGASAELIVASLLHDIGHLLYLDTSDGEFNLGINDSHEASGARFLGQWFPPAVTAPIALHVEAKRYLCHIDEGYFATLSEGSVRSLKVQGGKMSETKAARFEQMPHFDDAVSLRRWDDIGKVEDASMPAFSDFVSDIKSVLS
jgi:phosphonate degradation associated HDIG domain protein